MNQIQVTLVARFLGKLEVFSGQNARGPYEFHKATCLDQDYNKVVITLPDGFDRSKLVEDQRYVFHVNISASRGGYLQVNASAIEPATAPVKAAPAPVKAG